MYYEYIENELNQFLLTFENTELKEMVDYSLNGGKCIRGFIVKHVMNTLTKKEINFWEPIVCVELIHAISLIIDDLPCMDDDKIRRNKPSFFVKYGERKTLLLSFYCINEAFQIILNCVNNNEMFEKNKFDYIFKILKEWSINIGKDLIVGQMLDLEENINKMLNMDLKKEDTTLITHKTSSLFSFSFLLGGMFSGCDIEINDFKKMGYHFGIIYQLMDDAKDFKSDRKEANYILSYGVEKSKILFTKQKKEMLESLKKYDLGTTEMNELIDKIDTKFKEYIN